MRGIVVCACALAGCAGKPSGLVPADADVDASVADARPDAGPAMPDAAMPDAPPDAGQPDAPVDAGPPDARADANPSDLVVFGASNFVVDEGEGDGGSAPHLVVFRGQAIVAGATVSITPASGTVSIDVVATQVSSDNTYLAALVTAHVDPTLGSGGAQMIPLDVTVTQPAGAGTVSSTFPSGMSLLALPELTHLVVSQHGSIFYADTAQLAPLYSKIDLSSQPGVVLGGASRALFRAVSSIAVQNLTAIGGDGTGTSPGVATAGGCAGGGPGQAGACVGAGGGTTVSGANGGGAGLATSGHAGLGTGGGSGGPIVGTARVATYADNVSSGGGGCVDGAGGGGGGFIELSARGTLFANQILVRGGNGGGGVSGCAGGGGAGGIVVTRTTSGGRAVMISATGGTGIGGSGNSPGDGSPGRVRWDSPTSFAPSSDVGAHRGASFATGASQIVTSPDIDLAALGTPGDVVRVYVIDDTGQHDEASVTFDANSAGTVHATLAAGYNRVCMTLEDGSPGQIESDTCLELAYLP